MRILIILFSVFSLSLAVQSCKKDSASSANPLVNLNGTWKNTVWGGVPNNNIIINISQTSGSGVIQSLGTQTFNYTVGETILSNIVAGSGSSSFNCNAIFKYGTNNQTVANTTAVISLSSNNQEISITYAPVNGIQPPTYVYSRQ